jgi:Gar1/Naf1 RNA binding region
MKEVPRRAEAFSSRNLDWCLLRPIINGAVPKSPVCIEITARSWKAPSSDAPLLSLDGLWDQLQSILLRSGYIACGTGLVIILVSLFSLPITGAGGGRGGFASRGAPRGGGFGGRGGGRGGFGGARPAFDQGPPDTVVELGYVMHSCEGELVCRCTNEKVPYFNAFAYLENKTPIGKIDEILGPINEVVSLL